MDKLVAVALQEIAAEGVDGCTVSKLWSLLQGPSAGIDVHLDSPLKQVIWRGLLNVPGLSFQSASKQNAMPNDPTIQSVENAEQLGIIILASEDLRDGCLGLYDIKHADTQPSQIQYALLQRLAKARAEGVTQNQLGKEFKVEGNKLFYILRSLESRGLVVRRSTLVRNKDTQKGGGGSIVLTNLVHLTRYAKHLTLNSHQRFEISNSSETPASSARPNDGGKDSSLKGKHLTINDDLPAMRVVCDKLQQADGKVLVVSDLKLSLGYRLPSGHRAWRRLMKRLKEGSYVEIFDAKVGRKVRSCIRLLKPFSEQELSAPAAEADTEQQLKGPKRGQVTELLADLPVDQQIYDMIEDGGEDGLMMMDVWKRIGLNNKRNYYRIQGMTVRNGLRFESENHKRSTLYRLRTPNCKKRKVNTEEREGQDCTELEPFVNEGSKPEKLQSVRKNNDSLSDSMIKMDMETDLGNRAIVSMQPIEDSSVAADRMEAAEDTSNDLTVTTPTGNFPPPSLFRIGQPYPCLTVTTTNLQREVRVLERLQEETFIVRAELHRWLEGLSNRKTMMDRKTLTRTLQKLQAEGRCKCILLSMPGSTNCGRKRTAEVVVLPTVEVKQNSELLCKIHERIRKFDMESRGHGVPKEKSSLNSVPVLNGLKRMKVKSKKAAAPLQSDAGKTVALQANGFIPAKMVRVRMLHYFLWSYTNEMISEHTSLHFGGPQLLSDGVNYRVFGLMAALQAMPLQTFLQVIGSNKVIDHLAERCRHGLRICDLPQDEQVALLETNAGGRLAWLVDILRRLKLIHLVIGHGPVLQDRWQLNSIPVSLIEASLTYAMEEHLYIEQPAPPQPLPSLTKEFFDFSPRSRHEYNISSKDSLDNYWQALEYFFSGVEPSVARHAFPGSAAPELFGLRSWTSLRVMTIDQRNELIKRMQEGGVERRKSIQDCAKIAKDLNLTLEQVLRVSYEKNRRLRLQSLQKSDGPRNFMDAFVTTNPCIVELTSGNPYDQQQREDGDNDGVGPGVRVGGEEISTDKDDGDEEGDQVNHISIATKLKPCRSRRFPWSDKFDRLLIFGYARQRALLGAKINRVDWNVIPGLPALPEVCRRRMSLMKTEVTVKRAILNLCSLLSVRYERYCQLLERLEDEQADDEAAAGATTPSCSTSTSTSTSSLSYFDALTAGFEDDNGKAASSSLEFQWDDPDESTVSTAIDEVIRCKNLARSCFNKPGHNKRMLASCLGAEAASASTTSEAATPMLLPAPLIRDPLHLSPASGYMQVSKSISTANKSVTGRKRKACGRSKRRVRKKVKQKPVWLQTLSTEELVRRSIGVSNAVEFIKLVFLNTSVNSDDIQLPKAFMDALHQFKESDVLTAFNYLRDHNMVASGQGTQSFILSESFYHKASETPFPETTEEQSRSASKWLDEMSEQLEQEWIPYSIEDHFGQLVQIFGRVASGEILLSPKVPSDGIGESEDPRNIGCSFKRKSDSQEHTVKARLEVQHQDVFQAARRERGFPGIEVLLHRRVRPLSELLRFCDNAEAAIPSNFPPHLPHHQLPEFPQTVEVESEEGFTWPNPESLNFAFREIERAGEDGASIRDIASALELEGASWDLEYAERCVQSLESSGLVRQVNAFDHVRVVLQSHATRYFVEFVTKKGGKGASSPQKEYSPLCIGEYSSSSSSSSSFSSSLPPYSCDNTLPILPWLTSSGGVNEKMFKPLVRRVMGIVNLNPGITEDDIISHMQVLNPQTTRELLKIMELDGKLRVRSITYSRVSPPMLLVGLKSSKGDFAKHRHYYIHTLTTCSL